MSHSGDKSDDKKKVLIENNRNADGVIASLKGINSNLSKLARQLKQSSRMSLLMFNKPDDYLYLISTHFCSDAVPYVRSLNKYCAALAAQTGKSVVINNIMDLKKQLQQFKSLEKEIMPMLAGEEPVYTKFAAILKGKEGHGVTHLEETHKEIAAAINKSLVEISNFTPELQQKEVKGYEPPTLDQVLAPETKAGEPVKPQGNKVSKPSSKGSSNKC